ncbi:anaerobic sulfite reductase subunit A [bacterium BMS3Bbin11]|nr:anaerobic sulfite reductase subunit A [bacterium BMS3Bbin11]
MFSPHESLWQSSCETKGQITFQQTLPEKKPLAIIGVRSCDIAALYIHDKHFLQHGYADPYYRARRDGLLLIAVNCTHPAETCFCASTGDGPTASYGYDLLLTELDDGFIIQAHTEKGVSVRQQLKLNEATTAQRQAADRAMAQSKQQQRHLPSKNLSEKLQQNLQHPRWQEIAERCLSCGNCTSVCPTCFCHSEYEEAALDGSHSVHFRQWDSCFSQQHSYIHGLTIRPDTRLRYRQWMVHKLGSWHEQFARSGCVGCGRCITWCPVGIDFTEEAAIICEGEAHD